MVAPVTSVSLTWRVPSRRIRRDLPPILDIARVAYGIEHTETARAAALLLQREACRVTRSSEALCVVFDWPRRTAWTVHGRVTFDQLTELVAEVAGSGRRSVVGPAVVEPIGPAPTRAVLAIRRHARAYDDLELAALSRLASGVAARFEHLIIRRDDNPLGR
jgi:hypothetical protein